MTKEKYAILCSAILSLFTVAPQSSSATAATVDACYYPEVRTDAVTPGKFAISQSEIDEAAMKRLWQIANQRPEVATHVLGSVIAADQNWLGECSYPGIGLGLTTGSGQTVWFWVWAKDVDAAAAKRSVINYVSSQEPKTESSEWVLHPLATAQEDLSTVAQPLADDSMVIVAKHVTTQSSSLSVKRVLRSGSLYWSVVPDSLSNSEVYASVLTHDGQALFAGSQHLTTHDLFLLRVSPRGVLGRVVVNDSNGDEVPRALAQCADGSIYVAGIKQLSNSSDIFVARFSSSLQNEWMTTFGSLGNDDLFSISCGLDNSAKVSMWSSAQFMQRGSDVHYNYFLTSVSSSGSVTETVLADVDAGNLSPLAGAHASDGSYYVVGELNSSRSVGSCLGGSFVERFSPAGQLMWRSTIDCSNFNRKVAVDSRGRVVVAGTAVSRSGSDFLLHVYSPAGEKLSTSQVDVAKDDVAFSLAVNSEDHAVIGGYSGDQDVDWDATIATLSMVAATPAPAPTSTTATAPNETTTTSSVAAVAPTQAQQPVAVANAVVAPTPSLPRAATEVAPSLVAVENFVSPKRVKKCRTEIRKVFSKKSKKVVKVRKQVCR